ncbi:MAG TPA: tyrosine-type recombinase/integrase [Hymenobacter sp.]|uniref:tyrosine-type recombinase/integrase n=1 Tax=Hymenobacter sp. TaxID=1898978 RepID=UPI002D808559|nr:tyrosine-type recombinase/integrase [Hymenobacter sp.]HET9505360.1 tyrosine-type recombinase/integrase [Hymenobacter sp.]
MHIHSFVRSDGQKRYLLLDDDESIVELPTRFSYAQSTKIRYSGRTVLESLKTLKYLCEYIKVNYPNVGTIDEILTSLGPALIEEWLRHQRDCGRKSATLRNRDIIVKAFMDWLTTHEAGQIRLPVDNPYADGRLKTIAPTRPEAKYITYKEVATFIRHGFNNESERCLAHFLFDTGIRVSEVSRICQADLPNIQDYPANVMYFPLHIHGSKGRGETLKDRNTIISRPMLERILKLHSNWWVYMRAQSKYETEKMPVFINLLGQPISSEAIQKQFQVASKRLKRLKLLSRAISPHRLRHGTAYSILQSEHGREFIENLVVCQRMLGHNSVQTTEAYTSIPAPVIAQLQEHSSKKIPQERYREAEYIYEQSFKPQRAHTERRGHGRQSRVKK